MRLRTTIATLTLAAVCASTAAVAAPPPGKGNPHQGATGAQGAQTKGKPATGPSCRPRVAIVLKGTLASTPGASATSLSLNVTHANRHGAAFKALTQPLSILVDAKTVVRRQGKKTLADLLTGDRVLVQARGCKADLAAMGSSPVQLTATRVVAHPAKA